MIFLGKLVFYLGLFLTIGSFIAAFGFMFAGIDNWAKFSFMVIPIGFLLLFAGLSTHVLTEPRENDKQ